MKTTIKTIAKEAGVSVATVSYVLNDIGNVSPAVRELIKQIIKKYNYTPRAKKKKSVTTKKVLVVMNPHGSEDKFDLYDSLLVDGCETAISNSGNSMIIHRYISDETLKEVIEEKNPDGVLLIAKIGFDAAIPTVGVTGATTKSQNIDFVRCDDEYTALRAAELLNEAGCTKPAFVNFEPDHSAFIYRGQRFGHKFDELSKTSVQYCENSEKEVCLESLVTKIQNKEIDSLFIPGSDFCVITICMHLMKNRIVPGEDIKIICCVNALEHFKVMNPDITMMDLNIDKFGIAALNILQQRIEGVDLPIQRVLIRPTVV